MGIIHTFRQKLETHPGLNNAGTIHDVLEIMKDISAEICSPYIVRGTFSRDERIFEALLCGLDDLQFGKPLLFRLDWTGYSEPISEFSDVPYFAIGHAAQYVDSLMKLFYSKDLERAKIIEVASYVIMQTSLMDSSVGGNPHIVFVEPNKLPQLMGEKEVEEVVEAVTKLGSTLYKIQRGLFEKEEMYQMFKKYFLEGLGGIVQDKRRILIQLDHYRDLGPPLILGKTESEYQARNESSETKELFDLEGEPNVVCKGRVMIPTSKKYQIPDDPTGIWDLSTAIRGQGGGVSVNGKERQPEKLVEWVDPQDHSNGVSYKVLLQEKIGPNETKRVSTTSKTVFQIHDYILRKFNGFGKDIEVTVRKPKDMDIYVAWFLTPGAKIAIAHRSPTSLSQKVNGIIFPGNGFVVTWHPKRTSE
jgi:hypothetical protein